jgi:hypothetical protein
MLHFLEGFLGASDNERLVARTLANRHMTSLWLVATCMARMPPLKAQKHTIPCGTIRDSLGTEATQRIGLMVAWFCGVGALKMVQNLAI